MAEDGSVRIRVSVDTGDAQKSTEKLKETLGKLGEESKKSGSKIPEPFEKTQKSTSKLAAAVDKIKAKLPALGSAGSKAMEGITKAAKAGAAAAATAGAATVASIAKIGKEALESYSKYEQMVGGVDKLFGTGAASTVEEYADSVGKSVDQVQKEFNKLQKASQTVQKNADAAYKSAGMSANSYMESVTGFSAALINSLGGDTQKAAAQADVAMRAISDNANTFGTDTEMIVQTYQSLARGNYAMLDNLKLGYGGTKTELERLISDANKYAATNKDVAKEVGVSSKLQVSSFSDIVSAIELIQRKQGVAGTTAREAATTIEGSVNSMKAAWENWLTELGKSNGDIANSTQQLVDSVVTAASNVLPRIAQIMTSLGQAIGEQLPKIQSMIAEQFAKMDFNSIFDSLKSGASALMEGISSLVSSIDWAGVASTAITGVAGVVQSIGEYIKTNSAAIVVGVLDVVAQVVAGIVQSIPSVLEAVYSVIDGVCESIGNFGTTLGQSLDKDYQTVKTAVDSISKVVEESAASWDKSREACTEAADAATESIEHYAGLADQLDTLVDANGRVKKGHQKEAELIASVLNDALGTNITIRNGVIEKYGEEKKKLEELIATKKAEALASAYEDQYQDALKNRTQALSDLEQANQAVTTAEQAKTKAEQEYQAAAKAGSDFNTMKGLKEKAMAAESEWESAKKTASEAKSTYDEMNKTVSAYDKATAQINKGNYDGAIKSLNSLASSAVHSAKELSTMTDSAKLDALQDNIQSYANQVSLASKDMVSSVKKNVVDSVKEFAEAGGNITTSLCDGIKDGSGNVVITGKELFNSLKSSLSDKKALKLLGTTDYNEYVSGLKKNSKKLKSMGVEGGKNYGKGLGSGIAKSVDSAKNGAQKLINAANKGIKSNSTLKKTGESQGKSYGTGIGKGAGNAKTNAKKVSSSAGKGFESLQADKIGSQLSEKVSKGISNGSGKAKTAAKSVMTQAKSAANSEANTSSSIGSNMVQGIIRGVTAAAAPLYSTLANLASSALSAAKSALGIKSPSRRFMKEVGYQIPAGIAKGINARSKEAENASKKSATKVLKAATATLKKLNNYAKKNGQSTAKTTAVYWAQIAKSAKNGSKVQKTAFKNMQKAAKSYGNGLNAKLTAEYYESVAKAEQKTVNKSKKNSKTYKAALKAQKEALNSSYKAAKKYAATLNLGEEKTYWESKIALYKKAGTAGETALKNAKEQLKDVKASIKEAAATAKEEFLGVEDTSTKSLLEIRSELDETITSLKEGLEEAKAAAIEAGQTAKDELFGVEDASTKTVKEIKSNLQDTITSLMDTYTQAVENTKNTITSSLGFFKEFTSESTGSVNTLIGNLRSQAEAAADYNKVVADLQAKLGEQAPEFLSYLTDAGISSLADLKTVNSATADELQEMIDLFNERQKESESAAEKLNKDLYNTTSEGIKQAQVDALNEMTKAQEAYNASIESAFNTEIDAYHEANAKAIEAETQALNDAKAAYQAYKDEMKSLGKKVSASVKAQYEEEQKTREANIAALQAEIAEYEKAAEQRKTAMLAEVKVQFDAELDSITGLVDTAINGEGGLVDFAKKYAETLNTDILDATKSYAAFTTSALEAIEDATEESVDTQTETVKTGTTLITRTVQTAMESQYSAVKGTMSSMESTVQSTVNRINSMMSEIGAMQAAANAKEAAVGSTLSYMKANSGSTNLASAASVNWYAAGGVFNSPQVIGIGEQGTEYALRDYHLDAIAERMQGNQQMDFDAAITRLARALPNIIKNSTPDSISVNKREFGRLVREV